MDAISDAELVDRIRVGSREAADILVRRHTGLVRSVLRKMRRVPAWIEHDDLVQEGLHAIYRVAAESPPSGWSPEGGAKFSTFAYQRIWWAMSQVVAKSRPLPTGFEEIDESPARVASGEGVVEHLNRIPPIERSLVSLVFGLDGRPVSTAAAARRLGMSRGYARALLSQALCTMRRG